MFFRLLLLIVVIWIAIELFKFLYYRYNNTLPIIASIATPIFVTNSPRSSVQPLLSNSINLDGKNSDSINSDSINLDGKDGNLMFPQDITNSERNADENSANKSIDNNRIGPTSTVKSVSFREPLITNTDEASPDNKETHRIPNNIITGGRPDNIYHKPESAKKRISKLKKKS